MSKYMGVSLNGGKPMVVGYHHFRKPPYTWRIISVACKWLAMQRPLEREATPLRGLTNHGY